MVNVIIDSMITLKKEQLSDELLILIYKSYKFKKSIYTGGYEQIKLFTHDKQYINLPPNISFLTAILESENIKYTIDDKRFAPILNVPKCTFVPKMKPVNQNDVIDKIRELNYDCLLTLSTGSGKNAIALHLANYLKTPCLYISSQNSHIDNFKNELSKHIDNIENHILDIKSSWLKSDQSVKAYNFITTKSLTNLEIAEALKNKIGIIICDEFHKHTTAVKTRAGLYTLNPKYKLFLSATPETKIKGLTRCALSQNKVFYEESLDFKIDFQRILLGTDSEEILEICSDFYASYTEQKQTVYKDQAYLNSLSKFIALKVNQEKRGVLIHNDTKDFHNQMNILLKDQNIHSVIVNSDTPKDLIETILKSFEDGKIDVLIGGTALEEAISLYRLSSLISTSTAINSSRFIQLLGRLKRYDKSICDKQKEYFHISYDFISEKKYKYEIESQLDKLSFLNILKTIENKTSLCVLTAE